MMVQMLLKPLSAMWETKMVLKQPSSLAILRVTECKLSPFIILLTKGINHLLTSTQILWYSSSLLLQVTRGQSSKEGVLKQ